MKIRALLTILLSLILGFVIGFVVSQEVVHYRVKDVQSMSSQETFKTRTFSIIEPTDQQIELIDPIIDDYSVKFDEARDKMRKEYHGIITDFHAELRPFLSEEQMKKLEEFPKHFRYRGRDSVVNENKVKE